MNFKEANKSQREVILPLGAGQKHKKAVTIDELSLLF